MVAFFILNFDLFIEIFNKQTNCILMITSKNGCYRQTRQQLLTDIHNSTDTVTSGAFACSVLARGVN